jgi:tetratricopeptide (TPR) repeat protein
MTVTLERRLANFRAAGGGHGPAPSPRAIRAGAARLAASLDGELVETPGGAFVRVEGRSTILPVDRERLAALPGQPPAGAPLLCLDTETTGLATAAGTLAFLVGIGWWEGQAFRQVQLLLPDHADEPVFLEELARHIPAHGWLVTYNGRGFDWPLLVARYRMAGRAAPAHAGHLDLLPLVRRLFRHRMEDARLQTVERRLLGVRRHGDVEGWEIPGRYLDFLRFGEPGPLVDVVRHNDEDVRSLARLVAHVDAGYADPDRRSGAHPGDLAGLARAFLRAGRLEEALDCLDRAIEARPSAPSAAAPVAAGSRRLAEAPVPLRPTHQDERDPVDDDAWWHPSRVPDFGGATSRYGTPGSWRSIDAERLDTPWTDPRLLADRARLLRRSGRLHDAEQAWLRIADSGALRGALAWVEVAKLREHRFRDPAAALAAVETATRIVERQRAIGRPAPHLESALARRTARLRRRVATRAAAASRPSRPRLSRQPAA